jgi:predicted metal-binding membrane protein
VLRRDRWVVGGAIGIIVALAWSYVFWLANDMDTGGMDMTGFRMIPAEWLITLVRSEGGRICCDFNDLPRWAKKLGAFPA